MTLHEFFDQLESLGRKTAIADEILAAGVPDEKLRAAIRLGVVMGDVAGTGYRRVRE